MAAAQSAPKVLAIVNGEKITEQDIARVADGRLRQLVESREPSQSDASFERDKLSIRWDVLNYLIERKLIQAEATRRMMSEDDLIDSEIEAAVPEPTREAAEAFLVANSVRMPLIKRLSHAEAISQIRGYLSSQSANAIRATFVNELSHQYGVKTFLEPLRLDVTTNGFPTRGAPSAPVTIVEFTDFSCSDCASMAQSLQVLQKTNGDNLRIVYRQFPLAHINAEAQKAAEASLCANDQQRSWDFHDFLFDNQNDLKQDGLKKRAAELKLDTAAFESCLDSGQHVGDIDKELDEGYSLGVTMVPTIFINGRRFFGKRSPADLQPIIEEELSGGMVGQEPKPIVENDYVLTYKNAAPCASAGPTCGETIIVALGPTQVAGQKLTRGDVRAFKKGEKYAVPTGGDYIQVVMKLNRPAVKTPPVKVAPQGNTIIYDADRFFIFEEKLPVGGYRERHSHNQRLVVNINPTQLEQKVDGQDKPVIRDSIADDVHFNEPVVHDTKNIGKMPMRNIVIELKP